MASPSYSGPLPSAALEVPPEEPPRLAAATTKHSYGQILKSSALIGGSSVVSVAVGIIRTKAMAMLLGPAGVGLAGLYGSIADLTESVAGMGVNSSGVRQIAEAVSSGNTDRIARTAAVLRRTSVALGIVGALLLVGFSAQISDLTFGSSQHTAAVSLLSVAVLLRLIAAGQSATIQGMRRISDLAKIAVLGAVFGAAITIPIVYVFRADGVAPAIVGAAAMLILTSCWYGRKVYVPAPSMTNSEIRKEAASLLKLGFAFMASGLMTMGSGYAIRITVLRNIGFEAAGLYQSAWALGGLYVGFILQAMGADFFPRLTACANDNRACNRMVNEQALVGLLLAGPGALATLTFAPAVITLFYTAKFGAAVEILRWICLGAALRVITWPMGFIILAKGRQTLFFWSDFICTTVYVVLAIVCVKYFGLNGAGMAFFGLYIFHGLITYPIVYRLSGFRWSRENKQTGLLFLCLLSMVFCGFYVLPFVWAVCAGATAALLSGVYSLRTLLTLVSLDSVPRPVRRLLSGLGFAPSV